MANSDHCELITQWMYDFCRMRGAKCNVQLHIQMLEDSRCPLCERSDLQVTLLAMAKDEPRSW